MSATKHDLQPKEGCYVHPPIPPSEFEAKSKSFACTHLLQSFCCWIALDKG